MKQLQFEDLKKIVINYLKKIKSEIEVGVITSSNISNELGKIKYVLLKNKKFKTVIQVNFDNEFSRHHYGNFEEFIKSFEKFFTENCRIVFKGKVKKIISNKQEVIYHIPELGFFKHFCNPNIKNPSLLNTWRFFVVWDKKLKGMVWQLEEKEMIIEVL